MSSSSRFEPKIVGFICKWCTSAAADLAGVSRLKYQPNVVSLRVMCSSRVDPEHILQAFKGGADGVLVGGCHPGDCHYQVGNYQTRKRIMMLLEILKDMGISPTRLRLEWISASEGAKFQDTMNEFINTIRELGPLGLKVK
ncbi:MAG: hydrogenase iron-sulfur subunit [Candidatus Omnitrophota bacterium]|nr:MAG: hydrogenase iron-sulfur subunit [Candidatus Omnitrophota bacterium]